MKYILLYCLFCLCSCSSVNKSEFMKGYVHGYRDGCLEEAKTRNQKDACEQRFNIHRSKYNIKTED